MVVCDSLTSRWISRLVLDRETADETCPPSNLGQAKAAAMSKLPPPSGRSQRVLAVVVVGHPSSLLVPQWPLESVSMSRAFIRID